jgi:tripartite ATP-independent transporter DctM subunit
MGLAVILAALVVALMSGLWVASAIGLVGTATSLIFIENTGDAVARLLWNQGNSSVMTALPLFVFMGEVLVAAGFSKRLYEACGALLGRLPGGLLHTNIAACALFASISGSSVATAATIGTVALPELKKRNYNMRYALGSVSAGGTLGILIPPSMSMIIYATLSDASIGKLFVAGVVPGIMLALLFMIFIFAISYFRPDIAPRDKEKMSWGSRLALAKESWPIAVIGVLTFVAIYTGVTTVTETAAIGSFVSMLIGFAYKSLKLSDLREALLKTVRTTSMLMFIIAAGAILSFVLAYLRLPAMLVKSVTDIGLSPLAFLLIMYLLYLIMGCLMDPTTMMVVTVPIILPTLIALGYNPIWFGVAITILVEIANITPPVGLNLYVLHGVVEGTTMRDIIVGILPFFAVMLAALALVTAFPILTLWLPGSM